MFYELRPFLLSKKNSFKKDILMYKKKNFFLSFNILILTFQVLMKVKRKSHNRGDPMSLLYTIFPKFETFPVCVL